jgi:hypothetical protein
MTNSEVDCCQLKLSGVNENKLEDVVVSCLARLSIANQGGYQSMWLYMQELLRGLNVETLHRVLHQIRFIIISGVFLVPHSWCVVHCRWKGEEYHDCKCSGSCLRLHIVH